MKIGFRETRMFFDRDAVLKRIGRKRAKILSKAGAFVRTRARSSLRRRKRVSSPGEPPSSHSKNHPNLKTIFFTFDQPSESVVVGPAKFNQRIDALFQPAGGSVPEVLEHGGDVNILERIPGSRDRRKRKVHYEARPFMQPALEAEQGKFAGLFRDALK